MRSRRGQDGAGRASRSRFLALLASVAVLATAGACAAGVKGGGGGGAVATPTLLPPGGTYASAQDVTLSCATAAATIHYTTSGAAPTAESPVYGAPLHVDATTTIRALAVLDGHADSPVASATYTIGAPAAAGWTDLTQFLDADSHVVYVSSAGSDTAAAAVHGRGYYLAADPEIGSDPTRPSGQVVAYATFLAARGAVRVNRSIEDHPGDPLYPEWILFRRGDSIDMAGTALTRAEEGGPSAEKRRVFAAYGDPALPRPRLTGEGGGIAAWGVRGGNNLAIVSLENVNNFSLMYAAKNILFEDVAFRQTGTSGIQGVGVDNVQLRRCVFSGNFDSGSAHVQGVYVAEAGRILIEECVFDLNGYKENPFDPGTWTGSLVAGDKALAAGRGVQPLRTYFDRNLYLSSYTDLKVRGNIISRGGGGGSLQMRVGGVAERNLLMFNESALAVGHQQANRPYLQNALVRSNLVLHDDPLLPPGGFGGGLAVAVGELNRGVLEDNVVAHFQRPGNNSAMLFAGGIAAYETWPAQRAQHVTIRDNAAVAARYADVLRIASTGAADGIQAGSFAANALAVTTDGGAARSGDATCPTGVAFGSAASGGNRYYSAASKGFQAGDDTRTFTSWQAAGFDAASTSYPSVASLAAAAGWRTAAELNDPQGRNGWSATSSRTCSWSILATCPTTT